MYLYSNFSLNSDQLYRDPTRKELAEICRQLDIEYRGGGVRLDTSQYLSVEMKTRIERYHYYNAISPRIIDTENTNYVVPPKREYTDVNGEPLSDEAIKYIETRMSEMLLDTTMGDAAKTVSLMGTVALLPIEDNNDGSHNIVILAPSDFTWTVSTHPRFPSKAISLEYETEDMVRHIYTMTHYTQLAEDDKIIETQEHKYKENAKAEGGMPWAITRYPYDPARFWGAPDTSLRDICREHRFLAAQIIAATQGNLQDILVLQGITDEDANVKTLDRPSGKVINLRVAYDKKGQAIQKSAYFINPSYLEPKAVQEIWADKWEEFQRDRGHAAKNFEVGAQPQSAEAQRLSDAGVGNDNAFKRTALIKLEQDFFKRWIQMNNTDSDNPQIPIDAKVIIYWQDDLSASARDKLAQDQFDLDNTIKTPVDLMMENNEGMTLTQATEKYAQNVQFKQSESVVESAEEPMNDEEETQVTEIEDPIKE